MPARVCEARARTHVCVCVCVDTASDLNPKGAGATSTEMQQCSPRRGVWLGSEPNVTFFQCQNHRTHADGFLKVFDFLVFMISNTFVVLVVSHAFHVVCFTRFSRFPNCLAFSLSPRIPHVCLSLAILCYTILSAPYYSILYYTTQDYNTLYYTILYTMLYSAILYYSAPYHTILYYTTQD